MSLAISLCLYPVLDQEFDYLVVYLRLPLIQRHPDRAQLHQQCVAMRLVHDPVYVSPVLQNQLRHLETDLSVLEHVLLLNAFQIRLLPPVA